LDSLGADSLDILEIQLTLEKFFGNSVDNLILSDTVNDIESKVYERTTNKGNNMAGKCSPEDW
jgi:acyl carrier protein